MTHTPNEIAAAVQQLDLWGKLRDDQYCRYHVGDRVTIEHMGTGTILGAQLSGWHYAILLDTGQAIRAEHISTITRSIK